MPETSGDGPANGRLAHAPDTCPAALLLIDVINDLDSPEGEQLLRFAVPMAEKIAALKRRARRAGIPCVYVNDNFGRWRSDFRATVEHCRREGSRGRAMVELLAPAADDYFVLKPKHSGFFQTTLDTLLRHLGARTLILTGVCSNICVFLTAADAHMRDYRLCVPTDCVASCTGTDNGHALDQMRRVFKADVRLSAELDLAALAGRAAERPADRVAVDAVEVQPTEGREVGTRA
jgi:nicotinamidase-related amidase